MTPTERKLNRDLRGLAQADPLEAPAHVERQLIAAFRKHRRRSVLARWGALGGGIAAIAAGLVVMVVLRPSSSGRAPQPVGIAQDTAGFIALPDADTDAPLEYATIVRVQLPLYALRDIGFAVNEQNGSDRVQADVLLGQDGLARAVRFVQ